MLTGYLLLLAATIVVELPIVAAAAGARRRGDAARAAVALNLLTHPLATAAVLLWPGSWAPAELGVVAIEYLGYRSLARLAVPRAAAAALLANLATAALALWW